MDIFKKWWFWLVIIVLIIGGYLFFSYPYYCVEGGLAENPRTICHTAWKEIVGGYTVP